MAAFFDKLGGIAKNLGDKASDSVNISKLNGKIKAEKASIIEQQQKIGEFYYQQHLAGQEGDPGAAELLAAIDGHNAAIAELQAEIARIQAENAAQAAAAAAPAAPAQPQGLFCAACGQENPVGTRFCSGCGSKLEQPEAPPPAPEPRVCACGAQVAPGVRFCGNCGAQFE